MKKMMSLFDVGYLNGMHWSQLSTKERNIVRRLQRMSMARLPADYRVQIRNPSDVGYELSYDYCLAVLEHTPR